MSTVILVSQLIIALGIYNVWLIRLNKATAWRGGSARTMEEEFHTYGLSTGCMRIVGAMKIAAATSLLVGVWYPPATLIGASTLAALMAAAVAMHIKVKDPAIKSLPAATLLVLSAIVAYGAGAT